MSRRREFSIPVRKEILLRARDERGELRCENPKCGALVRRGEIHHRKEDALEIDKSRKLTAVDGFFLCEPCHDELTRPFQTVIAKVMRVEANHVGASQPAGTIKSRPSSRKPRTHEGRARVNGVTAFMRQIRTITESEDANV